MVDMGILAAQYRAAKKKEDEARAFRQSLGERILALNDEMGGVLRTKNDYGLRVKPGANDYSLDIQAYEAAKLEHGADRPWPVRIKFEVDAKKYKEILIEGGPGADICRGFISIKTGKPTITTEEV